MLAEKENSFGDALTEAREQAGLTQEEAVDLLEAHGLEVANRTYQGWERNESKPRKKGQKEEALAILRDPASKKQELTEAHRHIGYELRDERGDVAVRVSIVMEVGKTRTGELRMVLH